MFFSFLKLVNCKVIFQIEIKLKKQEGIRWEKLESNIEDEVPTGTFIIIFVYK